MKDIDKYRLKMAVDALKQASSFMRQGGMVAKSMRVDNIIQDINLTIAEKERNEATEKT